LRGRGMSPVVPPTKHLDDHREVGFVTGHSRDDARTAANAESAPGCGGPGDVAPGHFGSSRLDASANTNDPTLPAVRRAALIEQARPPTP
jgi:hypothetical protein